MRFPQYSKARDKTQERHEKRPRKSGAFFLFRVFDGGRLAQDVHLDLAGIFHLFLDLFGKLARQNDHLVLADLVGLDHHAHLAAGLNGIGLVDAGIAAGDLLKLLEALDVVLQILAAGAGTGGRDRIRRLHEAGNDGLRLHVVVVRLQGARPR